MFLSCSYIATNRGAGGGSTCPPPNIFFKILRVSKIKCLVPPPPNIELLTVPPPPPPPSNLKVVPRSLIEAKLTKLSS